MSILLADYTAAPQALRVRAKLNLRAQPSTVAARTGRAQVDEVLSGDQLLDAEPYLGISHWYRQAGSGDYFWGGGVEPTPMLLLQLPLAMASVVHQRSDGSIRPLSEAIIRKIYGSFDYTERSGGMISIDPAWTAQQLVPFDHPVLRRIAVAPLQVHSKAHASFTAVFDAIEQAGLAELVLACSGTFCAHHMGNDPKRGLSSHSWGIAIDLNVPWNSYHSPPAPKGSRGSVQELVPYFAEQGFAWGGDFSYSYIDGMHFELARLDL